MNRQIMAAGLGMTLLLSLIQGLAADGLDELVVEGEKTVKRAGDFRFTEGPVADKQGNVYFSDIPNQRIHKWSVDGTLSTVREMSGGANGLAFAANGDLYACEGVARRVTSMSPNGKVTVLADSYGGKKLNSPNDLWIDKKGGVFFTDPRYGSMDGVEQDGFHVYYISPDRKSVERVIDDLVKPNGIIGTRDGKTLYVADLGARTTYSYRIKNSGALGERRKLCDEGSDGMTLDSEGNIYLTTAAVQVYSPRGVKLGTITAGEGPANVCFGGPNRDILYITARTSLYSIKMKVQGQ
jgi:gluconolactonase